MKFSFSNETSLVSAMVKKVSQKEEEPSESSFSHATDFILVVRDFSLDLRRRGVPITADEYLDWILQPKPEKDDDYNEQRHAIHNVFRRIKCFTLDRPAKR